MGLTSEYLRYNPVGVFGCITSSRSPPVYLSSKLVACGCNENILVWNVTTGQRVALLRGKNSPVTFISGRPGASNELACGYQDGTVGMWSLQQEDEPLVLLHGHKRHVAVLVWNESGTRLASGGGDCDVIVWDAVDQCGLYRLKGHKERVTSLAFVNNNDDAFVLSASADRTLKLWRLATQHCEVTNVHHRAQINSMCVVGDLVWCGSDDPQLRVFRLSFGSLDEETASEARISYYGAVNRSHTDRTTFVMAIDNLIISHGTRNAIDVWILNTDEEIKKRTKKRLKKLKRERSDETEKEVEIDESVILQDRVKNNHLNPLTINSSGKLRGLDALKTGPGQYRLVAAQSSNQIHVHKMTVSADAQIDSSSLGKISLPGHREAPRAVQFSADNRALVTGSDAIKVWSVESCKCVRTVPMAQPITCVEYCSGDRQLVAGSKSGALYIVDIATAEVIQEITDAHEGEVWQIRKHRGDWATVGTDGNLKLWKLDYAGEAISMSLKKTLKLSESALAVEFTADKKFIAVSLLDNTVKVFYRDTLKFWNSLYGHQLPVNCLAASSDSTLMATGSADRSVKLWGMDFADCHKSFLAHDKAVVSVAWVADTHLLFSMGKDGEIKQWDGDKFKLIQKLNGHHDEINAAVCSFNGDLVCSVSKDKSIRLWERSEELVVLEEEEAKRREEEAKLALQSSEVHADQVIAGVNPETEEATLAQVDIEQAASAAERLIESIEIHQASRRDKTYEHPILANLGLSSFEYCVKSLTDIHINEMESALLLLPMGLLGVMMGVLCEAIEKRVKVERASTVLASVQRLFLPQLISSNKYTQVLERAKDVTRGALDEMKTTADFNYAVLALMQDKISERSDASMFADAIEKKKKRDNKRVKKAVLIV